MVTPLTTGTEIHARYVIVDLLHQGKQSAVYLARDQRNGKNLFALKEIENPGSIDRYKVAFESVALKKLHHPALPLVYDVFSDETLGRVYILMEYIEGQNLERIQLRQPGGCFSLSQVMTLMAPIMDAVMYLHSQHSPGIHCDIKRTNIIQPHASDTTMLVDLGISKIENIHTAATVGKHHTQSKNAIPEQDCQETGLAADIYALGVIFYTLVTGSVPVDPFYRSLDLGNKKPDPLVPVDQLTPAIPEYVSSAIMHALSIRSSGYFTSVEQFWYALNIAPQIKETPEPQIRVGAGEEHVHSRGEPLWLPYTAAQNTENNDELQITESSMVVGNHLQDQPSVSHFGKPGKLVFIVLAVCFTLLIMGAGIGISLHFNFAGRHNAGAVFSTSVHRVKLTHPHTIPNTNANVLSIIDESVVERYHGTIHDIPGNVTTTMSLTATQQEEDISGYFTGLHQTGLLKGIINGTRHIRFMVITITGNLIISFEGVLGPSGNFAGSFCTFNASGQCIDYGIWSVTPSS